MQLHLCCLRGAHMKIVICEDEHYWREKLKVAISKWATSREVDIELQCTESPKELLACLKARTDIDALFLDILLGEKEKDGMALAAFIRRTGNTVPLIFVTNDTLRAADGYLVEAMGFLSKPIDDGRLSLFLDRIMKQQRGSKTIKLHAEGRMITIHEKHIIYVELKDHSAIYITTQGDIKLRGSASEVLATLSEDYFLQIHRAYVVALEKIHSVKTTHPYSVELQSIGGSISLPVSRKFMSKLMEMYSDEVLEKMI